MNNLNQQYFKSKEIHRKNFKRWGWVLWITIFSLIMIIIIMEIYGQLIAQQINYIYGKSFNY